MYCSISGVAPSPETSTATRSPAPKGRAGSTMSSICCAICAALAVAHTATPGSPGGAMGEGGFRVVADAYLDVAGFDREVGLAHRRDDAGRQADADAARVLDGLARGGDHLGQRAAL